MSKPTPFLHWLAGGHPIFFSFVHAVLGLCAWSLATDVPEWPWSLVGWCFVVVPFVMYWTGSYWYWSVKLERGNKC